MKLECVEQCLLEEQIRADERTKVIDEVFSAWVDWNSGKIDEEYFDDVIKSLKEKEHE